MKRGIIVGGQAYPSEEAQRAALGGGCDEVRVISPLTSEDRGAQWQAVCADLGEGDRVSVADLAFLGHTLAEICGAVIDLDERGVGLEVAGGDVAGLAAAARTLTSAHARAQRMHVSQLRAIAASRANATPPKCIFVPASLAE